MYALDHKEIKTHLKYDVIKGDAEKALLARPDEKKR